MKKINEVTVDEVVCEATSICKELSNKGFNMLTIRLIAEYMSMASTIGMSRGYSDYLLKKQVNNVADRK